MERLIYNIGKRKPPKIDTDDTFWEHIPAARWKWICYLTKNWERGKN